MTEEKREEIVEEEVIEEVAESTPASDEPEFTSIDDLRNLGNEETVAESTVQDPQVDPVEEAPAEVVEYTPDYTYKVKDEVLEFPEHLRSSIASKEHEDELRDLYTRAAGLDGYKSKNGELENQVEELSELKPQFDQLVNGYANIKKLRDDKDFHGLIQTLNWDKEDLLDFAETLLEEQELPEVERKTIEDNRRLSQQVESLQSKVSDFTVQTDAAQVAAEQAQLDGILANEAYAGNVALLKEVGVDVEQDVINLGTQMFNESGRKVYPQLGDVVAKVFESRAPLISRLTPVTQTNVTDPDQPAVETKQVVERQPTLPKVTGTNNNAIDETLSLDRLREIANQIPT